MTPTTSDPWRCPRAETTRDCRGSHFWQGAYAYVSATDTDHPPIDWPAIVAAARQARDGWPPAPLTPTGWYGAQHGDPRSRAVYASSMAADLRGPWALGLWYETAGAWALILERARSTR